jgi:hypothetical protein
MPRITYFPTGDDPLSPTCRRARQHASELLDDELDLPTRIRLRAHLTTCHECRHFSDELQSLTLRLRRHELAPAPLLTLDRRRPRKFVVPTAVALAAAALIAVTVLQTRNSADRARLLPRTEGIFLRVESKISYDHTTHLS